MKHVVIYGPPAVGKYAVEVELEKRTGFKRIQRRLTYPTILALFEWGSESFKKVLYETHTLMMAEAASVGIDIIFTFVFSPSKSDVARGYLESVEQHGGDVCLVRLFSAPDVMEQRVSEPWRADVGLMSSVEQLRAYYEKNSDIDAAISGRSSLEIDTGVHSTAEVVDKIISHYQLPLKPAA
jgi:hypothetical protein